MSASGWCLFTSVLILVFVINDVALVFIRARKTPGVRIQRRLVFRLAFDEDSYSCQTRLPLVNERRWVLYVALMRRVAWLGGRKGGKHG